MAVSGDSLLGRLTQTKNLVTLNCFLNVNIFQWLKAEPREINMAHSESTCLRSWPWRKNPKSRGFFLRILSKAILHVHEKICPFSAEQSFGPVIQCEEVFYLLGRMDCLLSTEQCLISTPHLPRILAEIWGELAVVWDRAQRQQRHHNQCLRGHAERKKDLQTTAYCAWTVENMTAWKSELLFQFITQSHGYRSYVHSSIWTSRKVK